MPFAYVTTPGIYLRKSGGRFLLDDGEKTVASFARAHLESITFRGQIHISTSALRAMLQVGTQATFLTTNGKLLGHLSTPKSGNSQLRIAQYELHFNESGKLDYSRLTVREKVEAMLEIVGRYLDNYPDQKLRVAKHKLKVSLESVDRAQNIPQLLGIEGNASSIYWSIFTHLNRSQLGFCGRSRRPPRDELNALLSLGYIFLTNEVRALLESLGFDPFIGFYHRIKNNRPSLALDVLEPFRHLIVDRLVLKLANLGRLKVDDFTGNEAEGYRLTKRGWKLFLAQYEETMLSTPSGMMADQHPLAQSWREILRQHCLRYRRQMTGNDLTNEMQVPSCEAQDE